MFRDNIGILGVCHLFLFGVLIPSAALRSKQRLASRPLPRRDRAFVAAIVQQIIFAGFSIWVATKQDIELFPVPAVELPAVAVGFVMLVAAIGFMLPRWKRNVVNRERKIYIFMPRTGAERAFWLALSAAAGAGEEITYRGVLFTLLLRLIGNSPLAALAGAVVFGLSHLVQGWKTAAIVVLFALSFQSLVYHSGSLYSAIVVHFLYDATAGLMYGYFADRFGYPAEPMPPPEPVARPESSTDVVTVMI